MRANLIRRSKAGLAAGVILGALYVATAAPAAQTVAVKETALDIQRALQRLPYYGVFDYLEFSADRGTVTLQGYAYQGSLKSDARRAVTKVSGVDEVANNIELLPASQNDDRIRWATFVRIYNDSFLSRYAPGGGISRYDLRTFRRFGTQPVGDYPIHIIVKNGRTTLLGAVGSESDKILAGFRAREVSGVFGVTNELVVSNN
jgi:osmotically-inducible protein OsmY